MKVIVEPAHDTPLVSFQIANRVGSAHERPGSEGLVCHTTELSTRGAGQLGRRALDESIEVLGAGIGFGLRRDYVSLRANCLHKHLDRCFDLALQVLEEPRFDEEEHEKLRRETIHDLDELRDDDATLAHRFFAKHCLPGYAYCRTALGTKESLGSLDLAAVRSLYPRLMHAEQLVVGMVGPVDESAARALADKIPGSSDSEPLPRTTLDRPPDLKGRRLIIVDKPERQQCQIVLGQLSPVYGSTDHDLLRVAETAFGGMFTSRLMQEIRVKHGWSYGAQCAMHRARGEHFLQVSLAPAAEQCADALARTLEMYDELVSDGLAADEFEFTRSYLRGSSAFTRATAQQRLFRKVQEEVLDLSPGFGNAFPERLAGAQCDEVNAAIRRCLTPGDLCIVVVATAETMRPKLENLGWSSIEIVDYRSY
jgi:zinc protease